MKKEIHLHTDSGMTLSSSFAPEPIPYTSRLRGITINSAPAQFQGIERMKKGDKKSFWKKGKLRFK